MIILEDDENRRAEVAGPGTLAGDCSSCFPGGKLNVLAALLVRVAAARKWGPRCRSLGPHLFNLVTRVS
jgi:hypothetical protein